MDRENAESLAEQEEAIEAVVDSRKTAIVTAIAELDAVRQFILDELKKGEDYGTIPGTQRDCLFQPGAQKIAMYFNTRAEYHVERFELDGGHVEFVVHTALVNRKNGIVLANGLGSCSTMEKKYRWRESQRACVECGLEGAITKTKNFKNLPNWTPEWLCWEKKGGCNARFPIDDPRMGATQKVENPDIADVRNTVLKMGKKRSFVDAAIALSCVSDKFTQDVDDAIDLSGVAPAATTLAATS